MRQSGVDLMVPELSPADELSVVFARMSGLLLSEETVGTAVGLVTALATKAIPGVRWSGSTTSGPTRGGRGGPERWSRSACGRR